MNQHDPIVGRYVYVTCQGKTYRTYYEETGDGIPMVCLHTAGTEHSLVMLPGISRRRAEEIRDAIRARISDAPW
jgi:hypothetical protein